MSTLDGPPGISKQHSEQRVQFTGLDLSRSLQTGRSVLKHARYLLGMNKYAFPRLSEQWQQSGGLS